MNPGNIPRQTLLIVDDEPLIRWSLAQHLTDAGYAVVEACDEASAVTCMAPGAPRVDLVILDLKLPDGDGLTLLRKIKAVHPACPVILMTAFGTPETAAEAMGSGAFRVLNKPFDLTHIAALVSAALASATA